jgi:uncharacterized protein YigA (DUF484 family)
MDTNHPITEDDIAHFLANTPDFFLRHAQLLADVQLSSPHSNRAVSLQERQAEMLREKIKSLEHKVVEMIRHGQENVLIADKLQRWTRDLLMSPQPHDIPSRIAVGIVEHFAVPQVAIKVWGVSQAFLGEPFAQGVSDDAKTFATSLTQPYCGVNVGFEATTWLDDPAFALSMALLPLRLELATPAFGMLVLASPDPLRFHNAMGTDFLERISDLAAAALSRLK